MNERMFELIQQQNDNRGLLWTEEDKEEFAELIVRECVEVCAGVAAAQAGYGDAPGRDAAYCCGDSIKELFGLE